MNGTVLAIFLGIGIFCFLLIQPLLSFPTSFSIFSILQNDIHLFSNTIRQQETIQEISADNSIKNGNNIDVTTSRESASRDIPFGLWTPINTSFALQHLKGEEQEKAMD
ncbi:MAG TPA: hypothetical protein VNB67_06880, partial [Nitrososphaeraceae archaeon]|nr:hypothetical protein [Nitrososphaeraceae archaeon]